MLKKFHKKCPDVLVRRLPNENQYRVWVNGDEAGQYDDGEMAWSRYIFISDKHKVVVKIDDQHIPQSRNEAVFWNEVVERKHKKYFAPVLGWGVTSLIASRGYYDPDQKKFVDKMVKSKCFYVVQEYIEGAEEVFGNGNDPSLRKLLDNVQGIINHYEIGDFSYRQIKRDKSGDVKIHDYGIIWDGSSSDYIESKSIPRSPYTALKKRKLLEKV